jgi:hypothetical protein
MPLRLSFPAQQVFWLRSFEGKISLVKSGRRAREVQTPERFRLTTNGSSLWALDAN